MADVVVITGDQLRVSIPPPAVIPQLQVPIPLSGSSKSMTIEGMPVCLRGDELPVQLRVPLQYTAPPFIIPGMGTLTLTVLPENFTQLTTNQGKPLLIRGGEFPALFTVEQPATQPTPEGPIPDPQLEKPGTAQFICPSATVIAG
jgi:hypothetical protein